MNRVMIYFIMWKAGLYYKRKRVYTYLSIKIYILLKGVYRYVMVFVSYFIEKRRKGNKILNT